MLNSLSKKILVRLFQPLSNIELVYENTRTLLQTKEDGTSGDEMGEKDEIQTLY